MEWDVNLYVENNKDNPAMTYIFDLALKRDNGNFGIRFMKEKKEFNLDPVNQKILTRFMILSII